MYELKTKMDSYIFRLNVHCNKQCSNESRQNTYAVPILNFVLPSHHTFPPPPPSETSSRFGMYDVNTYIGN
jgi:hypothetical protein